MRALYLLALVAPMTALPAHAAGQAPQAADSAKDGEKVICRTTRVVGSNFSQRVCKTRNQWDDERRLSRNTLDFERGAPAASDRSQGVLGN